MPPAPSTIAVTTIVEFVRDFTPDAKSAKPHARAAPSARTISTAGSVGQGVRRPYDAAVEVPRTTEIAVVGAGAIGASAALQLALAGREVLLLDRGAVGQGASAGTACLITPSHAERLANPEALKEGIRFLTRPRRPALHPAHPRLLPWLTRFTAASVRGGVVARRHRRAAEVRRSRASSCTATGRPAHQTGLVENGVLNVWATEAGDEHRHRWADAHRAAGLEVQLLDAGEVQRARAARPRGAGTARCTPATRTSTRCGSCRSWPRAAETAGARVAHRRRHAAADADGVRRPARHDRRADPGHAGRRRRRRLVVEAGPRCRACRCRCGRRRATTWSTPASAGAAAADLPGREPRRGDAARRAASGLPARSSSAPIPTPSTTGASTPSPGPAPTWLDGLAGATPSAVWRGPRPVTADGMPMVGRAPGNERVIIAAGHAMLGITMAPITAAVGRAAGARRGSRRLEALAPGRFRGLPRLPRRR